jgi:hypothetical protein
MKTLVTMEWKNPRFTEYMAVDSAGLPLSGTLHDYATMAALEAAAVPGATWKQTLTQEEQK